MDIKFLIIIVVSVVGFIMLMNEITSLKKELNKRTQERDELLHMMTDEIKKESIVTYNKFRQYTNEMIQQFRTMSAIEQQPVIKLSDQFDESDENEKNREHIPYLSEVNNIGANVAEQKEQEKLENSSKSDINEEDVNKKHLKMIQTSLASNGDDVASEKLVFGETKKESDSDNSAPPILKKISTYTKPKLVSIAQQYGIDTRSTLGGKTKELTKKELYDSILDRIKQHDEN